MLKINPIFKNLIPPLAKEEYEQLERNIIKDGCRDALVTWKGTLIDGHNRYEICTKHDIKYSEVAMPFDTEQDAVEWIILNQFGRRNLSVFQRSELALELKPIIQSKAKERQREAGGDKVSEHARAVTQKSAEAITRKPKETRDELAKLAGVSHDTIEKVQTIKANGTEEQIQRAREGSKGNSVNAIYKEIRDQGMETKLCPKCGEEKPLSRFSNGKNACKDCLSKIKRENEPVRDFKGDIVPTNKEANELAKKHMENIARDIYDENRVIEITSDDLVDDLESFSNHFIRSADRVVGEYQVEITEENRKKIIAILSQVETAIKNMKGSFIYG